MQSYLCASSIMAQNCFKYNRQCQKLSKGRQIAVILAGLAIGVVTGLFGAGGGMLTVPALTFIAKFDEKHSHATAIAVILPLSVGRVSTLWRVDSMAPVSWQFTWPLVGERTP